jgi:hypothetical protein
MVTSTDVTQTGFTGNTATSAHKSLLLAQFQMMTLFYPEGYDIRAKQVH